MMRKLIAVIGAMSVLWCTSGHAFTVLLPESVRGVRHCRISLNGEWQFAMVPGATFWTKESPADGWQPIQVPGECRMQGFAIEHDREYAYRKVVYIPADFKGKRIVVRFNGVYSYARVWVNGTYVRSHHGGFTSWECDLTPFVTPGTTAILVVGVTDRADEISYASGYAKHPIGGILRGVELLALPGTHITTVDIRTTFNAQNRDAQLHLASALSRPQDAVLECSLYGPDGKHVPLKPGSIAFSATHPTGTLTSPVRAPLRWDAEHPRLYTLETKLIVKGKTEEVIRQRFGFREVAVRGRQLVVNGQPVKLRGACRHDIHPLLGRSTTPGQDLQDVLLAKEANFNFIRTSHYPPSAEFLQYCDEHGIYVEDESAVCFVSAGRPGIFQKAGGSGNDTTFTERYLSQLTEMVGRDRNHPCVILWSLGNESTYGTNFQRSFDTVRALDPTRPIIFSYAHTAPDSVHCYDILSMHYPSWDRCVRPTKPDSAMRLPVVSDEWMHVPCYCVQDLREDPGIQDAWGESMKLAWEFNFKSDYSIGGAIWGMIDEIFPLPDTSVGYGPWGIVDIWRRKKPEFWHTRKAYSPVRVNTARSDNYVRGTDLLLPLLNRFDHTNMQEVGIVCESGGATHRIISPAIAPHDSGTVTIPAALTTGDRITLRFQDASRREVDEEVISFESERIPPGVSSHDLRTEESALRILVSGKNFTVAFDRTTGLMESGTVAGERIIESGPIIRLITRGPALSWDVDTLLDVTGLTWTLDTMDVAASHEQVTVTSIGRGDSISVKLGISVSATGEIVTSYEIADPPERCQEIGVQFVLSSTLDLLSWSRRGLWSSYPEDHIGRTTGEAPKSVPGAEGERRRVKPEQPWCLDTKDFYLFPGSHGVLPSGGTVPRDFRSRKENILLYLVRDQRNGNGLRVESEGTVAARSAVKPDGSIQLFVDNEWTYLNLNWGNYERPVTLAHPFKGSVKVRLCSGK
jgi:hypothetical protein